MPTCGRVRLLLALTLVAAFAGCGGGSYGSGTGVNEVAYFHWACNGDSTCLSDAGAASGTTAYSEPGSSPADCNSAYDHAYIFWGVAAGYSCDSDPNGAPGAPIPAVTLPTITGFSSTGGGGIGIDGSDFPSDPDKVSVEFGTTPLTVIGAAPARLQVALDVRTQDKTAKFTVFVHGGQVTSGDFTFMNSLVAVAAGSSGQIFTTGSNETLRDSADGTTWQYVPAYKAFGGFDVGSFNGAAASPSVIVVVGDSGSLLTSADGVHFSLLTSQDFDGRNLNGVIWTGSMFVVFGDAGTLATSTDGAHWVLRATPTTKGIRNAVWNGSQFVACGDDGLLMTSPDGDSWTVQHVTSTFDQNLYGIAWGNGVFITVGTGPGGGEATALVSPDGVAWTAVDPNVPPALNGVAWSGTAFVAVGALGEITTSPDATNWTPVTGAPTLGDTLAAVTYANALFIAVGENGTILTSPDGANWSRVSGY